MKEFVDLSSLETGACTNKTSTPEVKPLQAPASQGGKVITHKFYLEIAQYPNGMVYPKIVPLGSAYKQGKKKKARKAANKVTIGSVEEH